MNNNMNKILEEKVEWFKNADFDGDLSAFVDRTLDIREGIDDVLFRILPILLRSQPSQPEQVLLVIEDLQRQLEHIAKHAREMALIGNKLMEFFEAKSTG